MVALIAACKVTGEDVEHWKGTVKGPGKIKAVVLADKYPMELRTRAALALVQMERNDVDGNNELQSALQRLPEDTQRQIIDGMTPGLIAMMRGEGAAQAPTEAGVLPPPTAQQKRAKDAGFLLIARASPATRAMLTDAVVGWYVQDFGGRLLAGNYSAEQVVRALGAPGAAVLVNALNARMPKEAMTKVAELVGQLGDPAAKTRTAQRLIEIEREMESEAFLAWLKGNVRAQLQQAAGAGRPVNEARVTEVATFNRESFINDGVLPAMKFLADQPTVAARLLEIASQPSVEGDLLSERRKRSLMALEGKATQAMLQQLLTIALDPAAPISVRDYSFDRVGDIRSAEALPRLWPLVSNIADWRLRWRVGEMVLSIGGAGVATEFLLKLPTGPDVTYAPEELAGYATRLGQLTPLPNEIMRAQLASPDWWDRVIALRYFERKGTAADIPALQALVSDATPVKGPEPRSWEAGYTVGKVAETALAGLREREATPAAPAAGAAPAAR
jgi:hypothetical protein